MRILLALCCALLGGAESLAIALPVVDTWRALARREPTLLPDGTPVRIGIQALSGPVGSGIAVYVLAPSGAPLAFSQASSDSDRTCGPVVVRHEHPEKPAHLVAQAIICEGQEPRGELVLYANIIPLAFGGVHTITVLTDSGQTLATATVTATDADYHVWGTLQEGHHPQVALPEQESDDTFRVDFTALIQPGDPALVAADSLEPWAQLNPAWLADVMAGTIPDLSLPIPEPTQPSPGLQTRIEANVITVQLPAEWHISSLYGFGASPILTRWWRNGQPWQQQRGNTDVSEILFDGGIQVTSYASILVHIHFDPETLPKGERIEVQLLFSRFGWQHLEPSQWLEQLAVESFAFGYESPEPPVLLTPRLVVADPDEVP